MVACIIKLKEFSSYLKLSLTLGFLNFVGVFAFNDFNVM